MDRTILHCDANCFFASVETYFHPEYAKVPMAVCGSKADRHGIVLAKNDLAKKYGVKTGEAIWQAQAKCGNLVIAAPHYDLYEEFSARMSKIFYQYTDLIEPYGIDESWLDVTASQKLFGDGETIANLIRERIKREIGITVSVGVSFNKVFAKLGSDIKKPDAVTVIPREGFKQKIYGLPAEDMLYVGRRMSKALERLSIYTIGDLANSDRNYMIKRFGKCGGMLWDYANGYDCSPVTPYGYSEPIKSVSNGMTFKRNLHGEDDVAFATHYLADMVATRLRKYGAQCRCVSVVIRDTNLESFVRQTTVAPTDVYNEIAHYAIDLIKANYDLSKDIYSLTVGTSQLLYGDTDDQCEFFEFNPRHDKLRALGKTLDKLRQKYGASSVVMAHAINNEVKPFQQLHRKITG